MPAAFVCLQGGSKPALTVKDFNGATPFQRATDNLHHALSKQLELAEMMYDAETGFGGPRGQMRWLIELKLCPLIWALIIVFTYLFMRHVSSVRV